jgi:hypothetical protein
MSVNMCYVCADFNVLISGARGEEIAVRSDVQRQNWQLFALSRCRQTYNHTYRHTSART